MKRKNIPYFAAMGGAVLVLVIILIISAVTGAGQKSALEAQASEIANLQNQVETQRAQVSAGSGSLVQSTTGIDLARKAKDDEAIKKFVETVTTWDSYESYMAMRSEIMETYALNAADRFSKVFLPDYGSITDADGTEHNVIDYSKISCEYRGMKSVVSGISGNVYSYFVIVTCGGGRDGNKSAFNVVFCCSVDGNSNISNLEAYTLS